MKYEVSPQITSRVYLDAIWVLLNPNASPVSLTGGTQSKTDVGMWWRNFLQYSIVVVARDDRRADLPAGVTRISRLGKSGNAVLREFVTDSRYDSRTFNGWTLEEAILKEAIAEAKKQGLAIVRYTPLPSIPQKYRDAATACGFVPTPGGGYELAIQ